MPKRAPKVVRRSEIRVKRKALRALVWKAFLPVFSYRVPIAQTDMDWFAARGIDEKSLQGALAVMRLVRGDVQILVRGLQEERGLDAFSFLIHDQAGGTTARLRKRAYIDLTLYFAKPVAIQHYFSTQWPAWQFVVPGGETTDVAGVDASLFTDKQVQTGIDLINAQCEWYLQLVESFGPQASHLDILKQVGQYLHFFANMSQLRVS